MQRIDSPRTDDNAIEAEIQAKGLTAPRVTPADIEANIAAENGFTLAAALEALGHPVHLSHKLVTLRVLVLRNGFTVVGKSACASEENFDADLGHKIARQDAINQVWPLMGYELKERLHSAPVVAAAVAQLDISAGNCETNAPIHEAEGRAEQAALSRANAQSYRAAIERLAV